VLDKLAEIDVIIAGRGGGGMEDLWAFNEECVASAIAACKTPVVSAVGHETDYTIADMAADLRAPTPSAAAELAVPVKEELLDGIAALQEDMTRAFEQLLERKKLQLSVLKQRLSAASPAQRSERIKATLNGLRLRLDLAAQTALTRKKNNLERASLRLRSSGPMETLQRGYAVVMKEDKLIRSASAVRTGDRLWILMADGTIEAVTQTAAPAKDPA